MIYCGLTILPITSHTRSWVRGRITEEWGANFIIIHGETIRPDEFPGLIANKDGDPVGLITYRINDGECEVITLNSWGAGLGVGSALLTAVQDMAKSSGCSRIIVTTTNNNLEALRFYQKRGFHLSALRLNALEATRNARPSILLLYENGLPIRDEIDLEMILDKVENDLHHKN